MAHNAPTAVPNNAHNREGTCGFMPYPGNGAYGHWTCQLPRRHWGRHRFNNYTVARVPHFWRARSLWRQWRCERRLRQFGMPRKFGYRRALYPTTFDPIEMTRP